MKPMELNVLTINCQGLRERKKRLKLYKWAKDNNIQILFLQETHFTNDIIRVHDKFDWHGQSYHSVGSSNSCGTSILIKCNSIEIVNHISFHEGRSNAVNILYGGESLWLLNIYAPNILTTRREFFKSCFEFLDDHILPSDGVIFGGDFNTVLNYKCDKRGGISKDFSDAIYLREQSVLRELVDIWRHKHPNSLEFTHQQMRQSLIETRIDYFLVSDWLKNNIVDSNIMGRFLSDHNPVLLKVEFNKIRKGKGLWKINNSLLEDSEYKKIIFDLIENLRKNICLQNVDMRLHWDLFKKEVKQRSIDYCIDKSNKTKDKQLYLQERLDYFNKVKVLSDEQKQEIKDIRRELNSLYDYKVHGALVRSRIKWYEEGERNNNFFLGHEKRNYQQKSLFKVLFAEVKLIF